MRYNYCMGPERQPRSSTQKVDDLLVSLILEGDGTFDCIVRWTGRSRSRPAALWQGKTKTAALIVLTLAQGVPAEGEVGRYGWNALHVCTASYGQCLNWRHLYWGSHKNNVADVVRGVVVLPATSRLPKTVAELRAEVHANRGDWRPRPGWAELIQFAKQTDNASQERKSA